LGCIVVPRNREIGGTAAAMILDATLDERHGLVVA